MQEYSLTFAIPSSGSEPFLKDGATLTALRQIANSHSLVLYCGAGVTRDRTGLSWDELVRSTFRYAKRRKHDRKLSNALEHLLSVDATSPKQRASLVFETFKKPGEEETGFLRPYLLKALYEENGWSEGYLLRNVALLAVFCAYLEKPVSLVTTNYDDYLDREVCEALDDFFGSPTPDEPIPGVRCIVLGDPTISHVIRAPINTSQYIDINFVHGRVDHNGVASGKVVFSENSYSATYRRTVDFLLPIFGKNSAVLTLGASLTDEPLIEALTLTKIHEGNRYAMLSVPSEVLRNANSAHVPSSDLTLHQVERVLAKRGEHLGVTSLFPSNFAQVAQFVEELRLCVLLQYLGEIARYEPQVSYPARLEQWWNAWSASSFATDHQDNYLFLRSALDDLVARFAADGLGRDKEVFRLELWVRKDPSARRNRRITLFANSTGPLMEDAALRREDIDRFSQIAAVRAFNEGKPILVGLEELDFSSSSTRWKTFLAAPIFIEETVDIDGTEFTGSLPVGVITLCSTLPISAAKRDDASALGDKSLMNADYKEIIAHILGAGREIVSP
jgi:hypothetical protein